MVFGDKQTDYQTDYQSGFRQNRGTADNLVEIESAMRNAISKRHHFIGIFFDLKKAYDTAWRRGILKQLHSFGLRGNLPLFIQNFLSNRNIKVRVGNTYSVEREVPEGVPQGRVLSCTLFMVAINGICDVMPGDMGEILVC